MGNGGERKISFLKAMLLGVNIMVGAGIFSGTSEMTAKAGTISFLGWLLAALLYSPVVWAVLRMAEIFPADRGVLSFCQVGLGRFGGFLGGWIYFVGYAAACAGVLSAARSYLMIKFTDIILFSNPYIFFFCAALLLLILNNMRVTVLASMQSYLTILKLLPVVSAILVLPFFWRKEILTNISIQDLALLPNTLTGAVFGFLGFETCASLIGIIDGGAKQARKAIVGGFVLVTLIYVFFHFSLISIMGAENLIMLQAPSFPLFVAKLFPWFGGVLLFLVSICSIVTYFNSSNGLFLLDTSVLSSLADEGILMFSKILQKRNIFDRPFIVAMLISSLVFGLGVMVQNTSSLMSLTCIAVMSSLLLAAISLWLKDTEATILGKFLNTLAVFVLFSLVLISFWLSGNTMGARLFILGLFIVKILVGMILYREDKSAINI